jgi:hypothetical protein
MRLHIRLARSLAPQIGRYELIDVSEGAFAPIGPDHAQLFAGLRERFPAVSQKLRPIEKSAGHATGFGFGVEHVT